MQTRVKIILIIILFLFYNNVSYSETLNVAVSSNFLNTFKIISKNFEKDYKCKIIISSDSTAHLFTKIKSGAPFDIFISADAKHPDLLETSDLKSISYAYGKIILWQKNYKIKKNSLNLLNNHDAFSIANTKLSPYGKASQNVINNMNFKFKNIILGENINHVFKYIYSKNSEIGITALSHIIYYKINKNYIWKIPQYLYPKIEQKMIILNKNNKFHFKNIFMKYMKQDNIKNLISSHGYKLTHD